MLDNLNSEKKDLGNDLEALKKDLASLTKQVGNIAEQKFNDLKETGKEMASGIERKAYYYGTRAKEAVGEAEYMAKQGVDYMEEQVKSHPFLATGVAFFIGMLIGTLSSNKRN